MYPHKSLFIVMIFFSFSYVFFLIQFYYSKLDLLEIKLDYISNLFYEIMSVSLLELQVLRVNSSVLFLFS